jgi:signal transduction histidine kinase
MTVLVLAVLTIVSLLGFVSFTQELILKTYDQGQLISQQIYEQVRNTVANEPRVAPPTDDRPALSTFLKDVLSSNIGLTSLLESTSNNSPTIVYLAVTDADNMILAHSNSSLVGTKLPSVEPFSKLAMAPPLRQLKAVYGSDQSTNYEVPLPMVDNSKRLVATVRIAMNTALIQKELNQYMRKNLATAGLALLIATTVAALLSTLLLKPLAFISAGIERMVKGEFGKPIHMRRRDELGLVSLGLNEIGQKLEVNREEIAALKGNIGQIVKSLEEKLIFLNPKQQIIVLSPSAASLLNLTLDSAMGRTLNEVLPKMHPLIDLVEAAFGLKQTLTKANVQLPSSSAPITIRVHLLEESGQSLGALVVFRDPHTVATLETQLEYAEKLAALNSLTSGIAHEIKNPLNAVVIHLELLRAKVTADSGAEKNLNIITQEIKRLERVVRNFLSFNKPLQVNLQETEIYPMIQEVVNLAFTEAARHNVQVLLENRNDLPRVRLDRDLIKQCLLNIVLNGCQAMPQGGDLRIGWGVQNSFLEIRVKDGGVGIPPEHRAKLFKLYFTTKENGNGIGLATVFKIVQLHNGEVLVDTELGKGSTFTVRLPVS